MLVCSLLATAAVGAARGQKGDKFISVYSSPRRERSEGKTIKDQESLHENCGKWIFLNCF